MKGGFSPLTYKASLPSPLGGAGTLEATGRVLAGSSVLTGVGQTCLLRWGDKILHFFSLLLLP